VARRKRRRQSAEKKLNLGALALVLAALALGGVGLLWRDAIGVPFGVYGGMIWTVALLLAFLFGLLYFSQFVLPGWDGRSWAQGLALIWRHYGQEANAYLKNLFRDDDRKEERKTARLGLPPSFESLRAGRLPSCQILAVVRGNRFARAAGPGFVLLYRGEQVQQVLDLRPHTRRQAVTATTRDGIPVETAVFVTFQIRRQVQDLRQGEMPYPYDRDIIFQVNQAHSVDAAGEYAVWSEQLGPRAAAKLVTELAARNLDDLYQVEGQSVSPLAAIQQRLKRELQQEADMLGLDVLAVSIGRLTLPEDVTRQRIKTWRSRWQKEIQVQQARGDAETIRRVKRARARVQVEIIHNIIQNIERMRRQDAADLSQIVLLRMIEVLEEASADASVQALIPEQVITDLLLDTSSQMRRLLDDSSSGVKEATDV
jgi:regulator of protease activity HflC (stomatin/prohibitin superfamily)